MSRIQQFLDDHRLTQTEVAEALGLDPSSINRKIVGARPWKLSEIQALMVFLSQRTGTAVTYEDLFPATVAAESTPEPEVTQ